jgi:triosephosphate isomerase
MTRRPLLAGNWKMFGDRGLAAELIDAAIAAAEAESGRDVLVAPPFTLLDFAAGRIGSKRVLLAAQDVHWEAKGAFTGEVSCAMLREVGCTHVIIGHSERRQFFGETDTSAGDKTAAALAAGLAPILCVGETLAEREAGTTAAVIDRQVRGGLAKVEGGRLGAVAIAYEPVWAIGTGKVATPEQAEEVHARIRALVGSLGGVAGAVRILYGGSVKPDNVDQLMAQPDLDGALVGGASLQADAFTRIVRFRA